MVRMETPIPVQEEEFDNSLGYPDTTPMLYWVPSPGVKCYTYDSRDALQKRIDRWAARERAMKQK